MPKTQACILWLSYVFTLPAWAMSLHDAPIKKVTIYLNGAMVERQIPIQQGQTSVSLDSMPANFSIEQLQANASPGIIIGNILSTDNQQQPILGNRSQSIQKRIETLENEIATLDIDIQAAKMQTAYLANMQASVNQSEQVRLQARNAYRIIYSSEQKKKKRTDALNHEKANLRNQGTQQTTARSLNIQLNAVRSGYVTLRYVVGNASWRPFYRASLDSSRAEVEIERMAMVKQQTGEDWQGIQLVLSSEKASAQSNPLQLKPWYLDINSSGWSTRENFVGLEGGFGKIRLGNLGSYRLDSPNFEDLGADLKQIWQAESVDLPYAISYQANQATTVYSSNEETVVPLDKNKLAVHLTARAAPRLEKTAIVEARLPILEGIWLPGEIKLFRDGSYVGQTQFQQAHADQTLTFGEDSRISVTVQKKGPQNKSGFGKRTIKISQDAYVITNNHPSNIDLVVLEPIPTSRHKEIKIKSLFSTEPAAKTWMGQDTVYQWQANLPAKGQFKLDVTHEFNYPDGLDVTGLPQ